MVCMNVYFNFVEKRVLITLHIFTENKITKQFKTLFLLLIKYTILLLCHTSYGKLCFIENCIITFLRAFDSSYMIIVINQVFV